MQASALQLGPQQLTGDCVVGLLEVNEAGKEFAALGALPLDGGAQDKCSLGAAVLAAEAKLACSPDASPFSPVAEATVQDGCIQLSREGANCNAAVAVTYVSVRPRLGDRRDGTECPRRRETS